MDAEFERGAVPEIYNALEVTFRPAGAEEESRLILETQQHLGDINVQIQAHESQAADSRSTALRIDGLCADLDDALSKLRATINSIKKKEHGAALLSLRRRVESFHNELIGLTGA